MQQNGKVIGIVGGSGPEAGIDLLRRILAVHRRRLGPHYRSDRDAPNVLLWNVPDVGGPRTSEDLVPGKGTYAASRAALLDAVVKLGSLVDVVCVACHALHVFEDDIRCALASEGKDPATFVSMVDITVRACERRLDPGKGDRAAILGVPPTMDLDGASPYKRVTERMGRGSVHAPSRSEVEAVRRVIWEVKEGGRPPADGPALRGYDEVLKLLSKKGVRLCVLACTELPLIDVGDGLTAGGMEFLDPTEELAEVLLEATQD